MLYLFIHNPNLCVPRPPHKKFVVVTTPQNSKVHVRIVPGISCKGLSQAEKSSDLQVDTHDQTLLVTHNRCMKNFDADSPQLLDEIRCLFQHAIFFHVFADFSVQLSSFSCEFILELDA